MIVSRGDYILSPLGEGTLANYDGVLRGESRLQRHQGMFGLPEPFTGSLFDRSFLKEITGARNEEYTHFESICIETIERGCRALHIRPDSEDTIFLISSTKGNVDLLMDNPEDERYFLGTSARKISEYFGNRNRPMVVSNACISGACAQIAGTALLESGRYRRAVICGADLLSRFIVSGFQSFKALSGEPCKPFDAGRTGLNLGEAAAMMIMERTDNAGDDEWICVASSNHNDANHISGPSRTGEGSYRVLSDLLRVIPADRIAFVNLHGTATNYNDEMESIAMSRAGLENVPANGLKGGYGHTLGAAGLLETILSMRAVENGTVLPTRGFSTLGTSRPLDVSPEARATDKRAFIKILSGFGGSNAGICWQKGGAS